MCLDDPQRLSASCPHFLASQTVKQIRNKTFWSEINESGVMAANKIDIGCHHPRVDSFQIQIHLFEKLKL